MPSEARLELGSQKLEIQTLKFIAHLDPLVTNRIDAE